jgi:hypothetical protein
MEIQEGCVIKIRVLYPNGDGHVSDMNDYLAKHIPLVRRLSSAALKRLRSRREWLAWPPVCPGLSRHGTFVLRIGPSLSGRVRASCVGDIPNYTNTQPAIQISQVKLF